MENTATDYLAQLIALLNSKEGYEEDIADYTGKSRECKSQIKQIDAAIYEIKRKQNIQGGN